jgi:hypothetical protein
MKSFIISIILLVMMAVPAMATDWDCKEYLIQQDNCYYLLSFQDMPQILSYKYKCNIGSGNGWSRPIFFSRYQYNPETNVIDLIDTQFEIEPFDYGLEMYQKRQRVMRIYENTLGGSYGR